MVEGNSTFKNSSCGSYICTSSTMNENSVEKNEVKEITETAELVEKEVENGKNKHLLKCKFCPSRILNPNLGDFVETKFDLPLMTRKKSDPQRKDIECETLHYFWQVNNMYTFENISFSNTVENMKYLACGDCEIGPIGYFNIDTKVSYVALERVNHVHK